MSRTRCCPEALNNCLEKMSEELNLTMIKSNKDWSNEPIKVKFRNVGKKEEA
jgi:hypothetical protein